MSDGYLGINKSYSRLIERLFATCFYGRPKWDLEVTQKLLAKLNSPQEDFKSILIAGTNGKGSVATKIAKGLELAGFRVGLYTSPHISSFRERIKINGIMISEGAVEAYLRSIFQLAEEHQIPATFFELTTALAFAYFAAEKVDFSVLEVGLGGRLDATNVAAPILTVITSISFDHTAILGSTLPLIAKEKGGIIRPHIPIILGPAAEQPILYEIAKEKEAPLIQVKLPKTDFYDLENQQIARTSLHELSKRFTLSDEAIESALLVRPPCRFQVLKREKSSNWTRAFPEAVILDVAHNPDGLEKLFSAVRMYYPGRLVRALVGMSKDKDLKSCLNVFSSQVVHLHLVQADSERAAPLEVLQKTLQELRYSSFTAHKSIEQGVLKAMEAAAEHGEILLICGSFYIMGKVRQSLGILEPHDTIDLHERF